MRKLTHDVSKHPVKCILAIIGIILYMIITISTMVWFIKPLMLTDVSKNQIVAIVTIIFMLITDIEGGVVIKYLVIAFVRSRNNH